MELSEKYKIELANLHKAVSSFEAALNATFDNLDSIGKERRVFHETLKFDRIKVSQALRSPRKNSAPSAFK